jgi:carbon monoxide dehydrogenase subunit G
MVVVWAEEEEVEVEE